MKQIILAFFLALLSGAAVTATGSGQQAPEQPAKPQEKEVPPSTVKVKGLVLTRDGDRVAKAEVNYKSPGAGSTVTTVTDSNGSFTIEGPAGTYEIRVKAGVTTQTFHEKIAQGTSLELILEH